MGKSAFIGKAGYFTIFILSIFESYSQRYETDSKRFLCS